MPLFNFGFNRSRNAPPTGRNGFNQNSYSGNYGYGQGFPGTPGLNFRRPGNWGGSNYFVPEQQYHGWGTPNLPRQGSSGGFQGAMPQGGGQGFFGNNMPRQGNPGGFQGASPQGGGQRAFGNNMPRQNSPGGFQSPPPQGGGHDFFGNNTPPQGSPGGFQSPPPQGGGQGFFGNNTPPQVNPGGFLHSPIPGNAESGQPTEQPNTPPPPQSLPDGVTVRPLNEQMKNELLRGNLGVIGSIDSQPTPAPPVQSDISEMLRGFIHDERNATIFYKHLSAAAPNPNYRSLLEGISEDCGRRKNIYGEIYNEINGESFNPADAQIQTELDFNKGVRWAISVESKALRKLCDLYESTSDSSLCKRFATQMHKKFCDLSDLHLISTQL